MPEMEAATILLVEDDPGHARLIEKNLRRAPLGNDIQRMEDGQQALDYLLGEGEFAGQTPAQPLLILLDLNLPGKDGFQVLQRIKAEERTRHIPVVVLTTTGDEREVSRCYDLGCNVYLTKPVDYAQFSAVIGRLGLFLAVVKIPDPEEGDHVPPPT